MGILTLGRGNGTLGAARQADALRAENVEVVPGVMGELKVNLATYGWFPAALPSDSEE
jgi:methylated-DNA-protein-cysteine methyltransferase related protein